MNREILDKGCERGIFGLVLAILVFGPLAMGAVETPYFLVIQALTIGVLLLWGLRFWLNPRPLLLWPPICWAVLAFVLYAVARYCTADLEYVARGEMVRVLIYAFLFFAILNNLYRQEHTNVINLTLIFLAMAISGYAIYQFVSNSDRVWAFTKPYAHRGSGTYISPNSLAGFLEMILPLGLAWTLVSRAKPVLKVFVGYASLVIVAGLAVTVSRGSWISMGLVLAVFFGVLIIHRTYRLPAMVLLALLVGAGLYFIPRTYFLQARIKEISANDRLNDSSRFQLWGPALLLWRENVWWGIGPNHFDYRFRAYRPETEQRQPDRVHNDYLNTLTDWGVAGTALVATAWVLLYAGVFRTWRFVRGISGDLGGGSSNKFALILGASMGLLAILFHSALDFNMHIPANAILAVSLMAMVSGSLRFATEDYWITARTAVKMLATLLLVAGVWYLGGQGIRGAREQFWLRRAAQAPDLPAAQAALERAASIEPWNSETAFALGETLRRQSWERGSDYVQLATAAMKWFDRSIALNPYDGYSFMRYGMCLDLLEQTADSAPYFSKAVKLDPNGYFTAANVGWHYFQTADYAAAKVWFERSKRLEFSTNLIAESYLPIVTQKLLEEASGPEPLSPMPIGPGTPR